MEKSSTPSGIKFDSKNIRQLALGDFQQLYEIWEAGTPVALLNPTVDVKEKADFYQ